MYALRGKVLVAMLFHFRTICAIAKTLPPKAGLLSEAVIIILDVYSGHV
jgi:hypothetical protein